MSENPEKEEFEPLAIDSVAREQIAALRNRFEGAHLVPGYKTIFRKMFQTIAEWSGWEIVGISSTFFVAIAVIILGFFFMARSCDLHEQTLQHERINQVRDQFSPTCEAMGLAFVTVQSVQFVNVNGVVGCTSGNCTSVVEHIVCAGEDRIVTINARDISETEVRMINQ